MIAGLCAAAAGAGQCADEERKTDTQLPEVVVRGEKTPMDRNLPAVSEGITDRKSTRLNSSH